MKRTLSVLLILTLLFTSGCTKIRFSYGGNGQVQGIKEYENAEDFEKDLENRVKQEQYKEELEEELTNLIGEDDGESGGLLSFLNNVDGSKMKIGGKTFEFKADPKEMASELVKNDIIVYDSMRGYLYDENGEKTSITLRYSNIGDKENYTEEGYAAEYFDGEKIKSAYKGKMICLHDMNTSPERQYYQKYKLMTSVKYDEKFKGNSATGFKTPDGCTEDTGHGKLDKKYWLETGNLGYRFSLYKNTIGACSLYVDGKQIELSKYRENVDKIMKLEGHESVKDFFQYLYDEFVSDLSKKGSSYGTVQIGYLLNLDQSDPIFRTEEIMNIAAIDLALCNGWKKMEDGEINSMVVISLEWDGDNAFSKADLTVEVY